MEYYIYAADVYCQACADDIKARIAREGFTPPDPDDETSYDSDEYPKGPFSGEESDSPQHCGSGLNCRNVIIFNDGGFAGDFLGNPLTSQGENYVRQRHHDSPSEITEFWMDHYGLHRRCEWCDVVIDDGKVCAQCRMDDILDTCEKS